MEKSEQEDMKISSATVRRLRTDRGWSQEQLAVASGLSLRTIQRIESDGSASIETRKSLAATFGIQLADLGVEVKVPHQSVSQPYALPVRYKVCAGVAGAAFCIVTLSIAGFLPESAAWLAAPSAMLAIASAIYSGFGWYFSCSNYTQSYLRRTALALFIFAALFCAFAFMRGNDSVSGVSVAGQIGLLSMVVYASLDFFISRRRSSAGGA